MTELVRLAGVGQLLLALVSALVVPRALAWRDELAKVSPLTRAIFWTYGVYISSINATFGLISTLAPQWLVDRAPLAAAVCAFIAAYWGARVVIQFVAYDRAGRPPGRRYVLAEAASVALFLALAVIYGVAALHDVGGLSG